MKRKIRLTVHLSRRLYKVLLDITPLFLDFDSEDPSRGAMTRALEDILQSFSESEEYTKKMRARKNLAMKFFSYLCEQDRLLTEKKININ